MAGAVLFFIWSVIRFIFPIKENYMVEVPADDYRVAKSEFKCPKCKEEYAIYSAFNLYLDNTPEMFCTCGYKFIGRTL